jgi:hypothetical protein
MSSLINKDLQKKIILIHVILSVSICDDYFVNKIELKNSILSTINFFILSKF